MERKKLRKSKEKKRKHQWNYSNKLRKINLRKVIEEKKCKDNVKKNYRKLQKEKKIQKYNDKKIW